MILFPSKQGHHREKAGSDWREVSYLWLVGGYGFVCPQYLDRMSISWNSAGGNLDEHIITWSQSITYRRALASSMLRERSGTREVDAKGWVNVRIITNWSSSKRILCREIEEIEVVSSAGFFISLSTYVSWYVAGSHWNWSTTYMHWREIRNLFLYETVPK